MGVWKLSPRNTITAIRMMLFLKRSEQCLVSWVSPPVSSSPLSLPQSSQAQVHESLPCPPRKPSLTTEPRLLIQQSQTVVPFLCAFPPSGGLPCRMASVTLSLPDFLTLGLGPGAWCLLRRCSTTELHPQPTP